MYLLLFLLKSSRSFIRNGKMRCIVLDRSWDVLECYLMHVWSVIVYQAFVGELDRVGQSVVLFLFFPEG